VVQQPALDRSLRRGHAAAGIARIKDHGTVVFNLHGVQVHGPLGPLPAAEPLKPK